jgi:hypothetical protein
MTVALIASPLLTPSKDQFSFPLISKHSPHRVDPALKILLLAQDSQSPPFTLS